MIKYRYTFTCDALDCNAEVNSDLMVIKSEPGGGGIRYPSLPGDWISITDKTRKIVCPIHAPKWKA